MNRTTRQLPKLNLDSELHELPIDSRVALEDVFGEETIYGIVLTHWIDADGVQGIRLKRTDEYGNPWLCPIRTIEDSEYIIVEVDGIAVQ